MTFTVVIWNMTIWNLETFKILTFWISNFKWFGFQRVRPFDNWTIQNPDSFIRISNGFYKMGPLVRISNCQASRYQTPLETCTNCKPTSFWPFQTQKCPDLRSPLFSDLLCIFIRFALQSILILLLVVCNVFINFFEQFSSDREMRRRIEYITKRLSHFYRK